MSSAIRFTFHHWGKTKCNCNILGITWITLIKHSKEGFLGLVVLNFLLDANCLFGIGASPCYMKKKLTYICIFRQIYMNYNCFRGRVNSIILYGFFFFWQTYFYLRLLHPLPVFISLPLLNWCSIFFHSDHLYLLFLHSFSLTSFTLGKVPYSNFQFSEITQIYEIRYENLGLEAFSENLWQLYFWIWAPSRNMIFPSMILLILSLWFHITL